MFSNLCVGKLAVCFLTFVLVSSDCISGVLTQTQVVASVAETNGLKTKQVKGVTEALFAVDCDKIKTNRHFKLAGRLNFKFETTNSTV